MAPTTRGKAKRDGEPEPLPLLDSAKISKPKTQTKETPVQIVKTKAKEPAKKTTKMKAKQPAIKGLRVEATESDISKESGVEALPLTTALKPKSKKTTKRAPKPEIVESSISEEEDLEALPPEQTFKPKRKVRFQTKGSVEPEPELQSEPRPKLKLEPEEKPEAEEKLELKDEPEPQERFVPEAGSEQNLVADFEAYVDSLTDEQIDAQFYIKIRLSDWFVLKDCYETLQDISHPIHARFPSTISLPQKEIRPLGDTRELDGLPPHFRNHITKLYEDFEEEIKKAEDPDVQNTLLAWNRNSHERFELASRLQVAKRESAALYKHICEKIRQGEFAEELKERMKTMDGKRYEVFTNRFGVVERMRVRKRKRGKRGKDEKDKNRVEGNGTEEDTAPRVTQPGWGSYDEQTAEYLNRTFGNMTDTNYQMSAASFPSNNLGASLAPESYTGFGSHSGPGSYSFGPRYDSAWPS